MKFVIAKSAGFCFGVKKAVETVNDNIGKFPQLYTLGEIIHNPQVVEDFRNKGVIPVANASAIDSGAIIIRSHGASKEKVDSFRLKNIHIIDATCPFVRRIQNIVEKALQKGEFIVIIGEREHPEVIGINGHCENKGVVVNNSDEVYSLPEVGGNVCVVAQTTTRKALYEELTSALRKKYDESRLQIYDTICDATAQRQQEALEIALRADVMVVIGGRQSSNTAKLFNICKEHCKRTYAVETTDDVSTIKINNNDIIGVTAGASTPDWLIKEVVERMSENLNENRSFAEQLEETMVTIRPGQIITGKVIYVKDDEVSVSIGYKMDGLISKEELTASGNENPKSLFNEGDEIEAEVVKVNDGNGNVVLSRRKIVARLEADKTIAGISNNEIFEVTVKEAVKGGVIADYYGVRVFIPQSQLRARGFAKDVDAFVGKTLRVRAIDIDENRRRVVATHGAVLREEREAQLDAAWAKLEVGATVKGIVRRLTDFGAFVDLGGVDGLVHVTDLAWYHINKPSDVLNVNQEVEVVVLSLDRERERISLGYKQLQPKPWDTAAEKYPVDTVVKGTVVRTAPFGAFVALEPGIDGLVHISRLSNKFVSKVEDAVKIGQEIEALVLEVDAENKHISLSIAALLENDEPADEPAAEDAAEAVNEATDAE